MFNFNKLRAIYQFITITLCLLFHGMGNANNFQDIENLLQKFKRPITILEVTDNSIEYTLKCASKFNKSVCIVLFLGKDYKRAIHEIKRSHLHNIVLLNPTSINYKDIDILSKCEHFDISIIHNDCFNIFDNFYNILNCFTRLGDYVFFEINDPKIQKILSEHKNIKLANDMDSDRKLFLSNIKKTKLELARFTQGHRPYQATQNYEIYSDFKQKLFNKKLLDKPINWTPGINLVTFVMLRGVYPQSQIIYENIQSMKDQIPYHNDLMIGNMVIQGYKIQPIDFKDKRRNANMDRCINRALRVFEQNSTRLKNPLACMEQYYKRKK